MMAIFPLSRSSKSLQKGEGEAGFLLLILFLAVSVSVAYYTLDWIKQVKAARAAIGTKADDRPPPKSFEDMGGYEIVY